MNTPGNLKYSKTHEWVKTEGGLTEIGITDFAQDALGDLVFVNLPEAGDTLSVGEAFADVESVKAVSDIYSPVSGTVAEVNDSLLDSPESINSDPYGAWFIRASDVTATEDLMDAEAYDAFCEEEAAKE